MADMSRQRGFYSEFLAPETSADIQVIFPVAHKLTQILRDKSKKGQSIRQLFMYPRNRGFHAQRIRSGEASIAG